MSALGAAFLTIGIMLALGLLIALFITMVNPANARRANPVLSEHLNRR